MVAALLILAAGAAFAGLSVAIGGGQAADMIAAYRTGVAGQAGITLVSLAYGANAAVWAAAYLLGPGLRAGHRLGGPADRGDRRPAAHPAAAGRPAERPDGRGRRRCCWPCRCSPAMAAGWLLTRRLIGVPTWWPGTCATAGTPTARRPLPPSRPGRWCSAGLLAGPVAGLVLGLLAWLSGGPLGDGRLADIGPVPWQVALVATAVVGVSASIGAAAGRAFRAPARTGHGRSNAPAERDGRPG